MTLDLDSSTIDVPCPGCGKKSKQRIGRLKRDPTLTCAGCGASIAVDAKQLRDAIRSVEKSLNDLTRRLGNLGKR